MTNSSNKISAAWWNESWSYRKAVSISNSSGSNLTNQRVKIILDTTSLITVGKLQSNCDDIRVTDINGKLLDHWDSNCNSSSTNVYIKVPNLTTSSNTLYIYYGNPSASNAETALGTESNPGTSCKMMKDQGSISTSGLYYVAPGGNDADKIQVYCDVATLSDGWTLVINNGANVVPPKPNWVNAINTVNITGTISTNLDTFDLLLGLKHWNYLGNTAMIQMGSSPTNITKRAHYSSISLNESNNYQLNLSGQTIDLGGTAPGFYSSHNSHQFTTYDSDHDTYATNCATNYSNTPWWYHSCWSGNIWGGGDTGGYQNKAYWTGSGSEYHNYGGILLGGTDTMKSVSSASPAAEEIGGGPTGYWSFDEGVGTTAFDSSSNKNHGGITAATWQTEDQCVSGKCLFFNGGTSSINLSDPSNNSLDFGTGNFTVEFWINYKGPTGTNLTPGTVINKNTGGSSGNPGYFAGITTYGGNGSNYGIVFSTTNGAWGDGNIEHTGAYDPNTWYHVTGVRNGNTFTIYKNAKYGTSVTKIGVGADISNSQTFRIGSGAWGPVNALIDGVKIYPYARNLSQIKSDYAAGLAHTSNNKGTSASLGSSNKNLDALSNGLIGYWKMDETSGNSSDSSGNNNTSNVSGNSNYGLGKFGNGFRSGIGVTNLITNPSFETSQSTWNYQFVSTGTSSTTNTKSLFGNYSLMLTRSVGGSEVNVYNSMSGLTPSTTYYYSAWAWANTTNTACIFTYLASTDLSPRCHTGSGKWERIGGTFVSSTTGTVQLRLSHSNNAQINSVYFDGVQVELGSNITSYTDGSLGAGNSWTGTAHASTSIRTSSSGIVNNTASLDITGTNISLGAWVYLYNYPQTYEVVFQKSGYYGGYRMMIDSGGHAYLGIGESTGGGLATTNVVSLNSWNYISLTYDGKTMKTFINGQLDSTKNYTNNLFSTTSGITFGATEYPPINGYVDEVRIYNRALSPSEVSQLYNWSPGPFAYWSLDENSGSVVNDVSGNNYSGTLGSGISSPSWTNGKYGSGLKFDGNQYVNFANFANKGISNNLPNFTVSAFIKPTLIDGNQKTIYAEGAGGTTAGSWAAIFLINNEIRVHFKTYNTGDLVLYDTSGANITANNSYFITVTRTGNQFTTYVNGIARGSGTHSGATWSTNPPGVSPSIGSHHYYSDSKYFYGTIDEVKIYNYARSSKQITEDMNAGHPAGGSPVGSQIGYWNFDEGYGTTAHDSSPNNNSCSLGTTTWTNNGKFNKALYFNGSSIVTGSKTLNISDEITISAWVKPATYDGNMKGIAGLIGYNPTWGYTLNITGAKLELRFQDSASNWRSVTSDDYFSASNINQWHYVAVVHNGINAKFYINGSLKGNVSYPYKTGSSNNTFQLGNVGWNNFTGIIDEVKIYNSALTDDEIKIDYNRGSALQFGSLSAGSGNTDPPTAASQEYCVPGDTSSCNPPIAEWKMDENTGTLANDTSGSNNTSTLGSGSQSPTWTVGKYNSGIKLAINKCFHGFTVISK